MRAVFAEVSSPGWSFWRAAADGCIGLMVGTLYAFLGILVAGIVGEEALSSLYGELDLDPVFRASMGVFLVASAVLGFGTPLVFVAERFAALRAVERMPGGTVPPRPLRLALSSSPYALMRTTTTVLFWCAAGIGAFFALAAVFTEDLREDRETWILLGGSVALAAICWALRAGSGALVHRSLGRLEARWGAWKRDVPVAVAADRQRRQVSVEVPVPGWLVTPGATLIGRIAKVLSVATVVALGGFMLSVFLRQQCRSCEPVYWDQPIENGIDVLSLSSGVAILSCAVLGLAAWIGGVALQAVREVALARWVRDGGARRIDVSLIEPLLAENRAAARLEHGLCAAGAIALILGWGVSWAQAEGVDPAPLVIIGAVLIVVGVLVGWLDGGRRARERQEIRDALFPGDAARAGDETKPRGDSVRRPRRRRR
ncbi:hypothetical protein [Streptomyces sp. AC495_CC817]|uniref:hypothetical protein n=1 Tax=Streptomyces sp. AC495_CC817 TaxID=2823900 RepID=UPI001C276F96|nr:hypothetical protein [Streptomyces sp. AC495_CC817]